MTTADPTSPTASPPVSGADEAIAADEHGWSRVLRFWHLAFYVMVGLTAAAVLLQRDGLDASGTVSLVALGTLLLAYATFGQRAAARSLHEPPGAAVWVYLALLVCVTCLVTTFDLLGTMLLFVAYSQIWLFAPDLRTGAAVSTVLAVCATVALLVHLDQLGQASWGAVAQMGLGLGFSILMGLWLHWILRQAAQRAELLRTLQRTQAELSRTQHAAGVVAERERMAREIHDTLAQGFTSIVMLTQTATAEAQHGSPEVVARRLELIERTARDNLAEARALVSAFSPAYLEASTLPEALERLGRRLAEETGVDVRTAVVGVTARPTDAQDETTHDGALPSAVEVVLLRTVQEALSNVRRHSRATSVDVALEVGESAAVVTVTDDGDGVPPDLVEGFGLRGMRDRVTASGGVTSIGVVAPHGTRVRVCVPLDPSTATQGRTGGEAR